MNTVNRLLDVTKEIWESYYEHPFVVGIQNGTLSKEQFRHYILQDYLYLEEYAKTFALGVAKAKNADIARLFAEYLNVMQEELNIHNGYFAMLEITEEEVEKTPRALDNLSYTSYMLRVAYEEGPAEILTAILSCAYSYECIAKNMLRQNPSADEHPFYGEWIRGYSSDHYAQANQVLMEKLNNLTQSYDEKQKQHLELIFTACSRYELAFWEFAWNQSF